MEIKNRQQILAIGAILALALLLGDKLVVTPLMANWKARSARIVELKKSIDDGNGIIRRETSLRGHWDKMKTNTLPENVSQAEGQLLRAFDRWTHDSRVSIGSIKPQWKGGEEDYTTLECHADATGSMEAVSRFLYEVEKDPLAVKIQSVEITARDDNGRQLSVGLQLSGLRLVPPTTP